MIGRILSGLALFVAAIVICVSCISYFDAVGKINDAIGDVEVFIGNIESTIASVEADIALSEATIDDVDGKLIDKGVEPLLKINVPNSVFLKLHTDQFNLDTNNAVKGNAVANEVATRAVTYAVMRSADFFTAYDISSVDEAIKNSQEAAIKFLNAIEAVNKIDTTISTPTIADITAVADVASAADALAKATRAIFWKVNQYNFIVRNVFLLTLTFFIVLNLYFFEIRSSYEKINQELASQFSAERSKIFREIINTKDEKVKKKLRQQAVTLRWEYETLLGENLEDEEGGAVFDWTEVPLAARKRLLKENERLLRRNVINLRYGITMAFIGVVFLASYVLLGDEIKQGDVIWVHIINYLPVLSAVIIFEIVAIFFLSLYSANERRLERNKSELTNIELRLTAGLMLYEEKNKKNFATLADNLSKEERNFILGKNESSGGVSESRLLDFISKFMFKGGVS